MAIKTDQASQHDAACEKKRFLPIWREEHIAFRPDVDSVSLEIVDALG